MKTKISLVTILVVAVLLALDCTHSTQTTGNGSGTGNAAIVGTLYLPDGHTPAAGVRVHIRPEKTLADTAGTALAKKLAVLAATDSVVTDSAGQYAFDTTLDTGTYVIEATNGNNAALIDSVAVKTKTTTDTLAPDTLKPAGALKGVIKLSEGGDPRKVFVLAFGIDRFARVNADGSFKFSGLAEAQYDLRLISSLDNYGVLDTNAIPVASADTTNLDTISLPFTGIPTPKNVRIAYDTLKQIVTVTWSKPDTALAKGFYVYRRNVDSNTVLARINTSPITDTLYRDSTGIQDQTYEYHISAIDKNATEGTKSAGVSVKVVSAFRLIKTITLSGADPFRIAVAKDSTIFIAYRSDNIIKVYNQTGDSINAFGQGIFSQPYGIALDSQINVYVADPNGKIVKFSKDGITLREWAIEAPTDIEIDNNDKIFVVYSNATKLGVLDSSGNIVDSSLLSNQTGNLSLDETGNIYLIDQGTSSINVYNSNLDVTATVTVVPSNMLKAVNSSHLYFIKPKQIGPNDVDDIFITDKTGLLVAKWGYFNILNEIRVVNKLIYLLNFNETPWQPQIQVFASPF
jgi:hypothetical protein